MLETTLRGLDFCHTHNILLVDFKPDNVLVSAEVGAKLRQTPPAPLTPEDFRALRLADFGLMRTLSWTKREGNSSLSMGTPDYRPPENSRGQ